MEECFEKSLRFGAGGGRWQNLQHKKSIIGTSLAIFGRLEVFNCENRASIGVVDDIRVWKKGPQFDNSKSKSSGFWYGNLNFLV